ncbi:MAG: D-arabinono-1,4-lactone oxidase [Ornithinimicrobium sp.]|uniref:D-arabinono-1,4-lactone oxidase n=1 Tax=Ornithinimicrobium sp. TaxID=1977084 RepID=UPI0026E0E087|nr:D-arabinono-1,4-lactone oxidase [Ornithinimicrobium sp.]MDO5740421.1 D-arabinono-1,4-lactone oxidase [Ornithinimicrobium sp.]
MKGAHTLRGLTRGRSAWHNWSGSVTARPVRVDRPWSQDEVVSVIHRAREQGLRVKAVGAGHSFSPIAHAPGVQVDLTGLTGLVAADATRGQVTLRAGTPLHAIPALLAPHGLAMANLGDIDRQTISGAVSTGTHGTGLGHGGLATQVVGLSLVDGTGQLRTFTQEDPELRGAVIGLGALGVVTEVTLQCVGAFALHAVERPEPLEHVLETFVERCQSEDHLEFYWFPHTGTASTKTNTRLPADSPLAPLSRRQRVLDDELLANGAYAATCRVGAQLPFIVPTLNRVAASLYGDRSFTDRSDRVFATSRRVRFHETEWAVELEAVPTVQREIEAMIRRHDFRVSFPLEFRAAAPDDLWLSTAHERTTGYVAAHRFAREDPTEYFRAVRDIALAHGGRPHWGKMHDLDHASLAARYRRMDDFLQLRDRLDPDRLFGNDYLTRVLGA